TGVSPGNSESTSSEEVVSQAVDKVDSYISASSSGSNHGWIA
ncbi:hypothetical protein Tco_0685281, partial [Tanacetum coccineum]